MRILIIEDDLDILESLRQSLESEAFAVDCVSDGELGSYVARTNEYDAVILDFMLPKRTGAVICADIRTAGKTFPIIMLTAISSIDKKVDLFNSGADDYVTKPFSVRELVARLRALLRRPRTIEPDILEIDDLRIDVPRQQVMRGTRSIYLTRKEFLLLEYLMRHRGIVISRAQILEHVWNRDTDPFSNTIESHILNIRKKIGESSGPRLIQTVPGRGYKIDCSR